MPPPSSPPQRLGFLTIGSFDRTDPRADHETTLRVIELGEQLGFDGAWLSGGRAHDGPAGVLRP